MNRWKEIAKFASGAEAFHAFVHAYFWYSNITLSPFGITQTPKINLIGALVNAGISVMLGSYAWGTFRR